MDCRRHHLLASHRDWRHDACVAVGEIIESRNPRYSTGEKVMGLFGGRNTPLPPTNMSTLKSFLATSRSHCISASSDQWLHGLFRPPRRRLAQSGRYRRCFDRGRCHRVLRGADRQDQGLPHGRYAAEPENYVNACMNSALTPRSTTKRGSTCTKRCVALVQKASMFISTTLQDQFQTLYCET